MMTKLARIVLPLWLVAIVLLCFLPQGVYPNLKDFSTPGIIQIGQVYMLPTPFNSLVNGGQVETLAGLGYVLLQNLTNVFLLYPLVLSCLILFENWRSLKRVIFYSFLISLGIETTQLVLDLLINAGRVVEIDDLWTNTLGGYLAYLTYQLISKKFSSWL